MTVRCQRKYCGLLWFAKMSLTPLSRLNKKQRRVSLQVQGDGKNRWQRNKQLRLYTGGFRTCHQKAKVQRYVYFLNAANCDPETTSFFAVQARGTQIVQQIQWRYFRIDEHKVEIVFIGWLSWRNANLAGGFAGRFCCFSVCFLWLCCTDLPCGSLGLFHSDFHCLRNCKDRA